METSPARIRTGLGQSRLQFWLGATEGQGLEGSYMATCEGIWLIAIVASFVSPACFSAAKLNQNALSPLLPAAISWSRTCALGFALFGGTAAETDRLLHCASAPVHFHTVFERRSCGIRFPERIRYVVMFVVSKANPPVLQRKPFAVSNDSVGLFRRQFEPVRNRRIRRRPTLLCPNLNHHILVASFPSAMKHSPRTLGEPGRLISPESSMSRRHSTIPIPIPI